MKHISIFIILSIFIAGCENPVSQELTSGQNTSAVSGLPIKWKSTSVFPLSMKMSNDFSTDEQDAINESTDTWSDETGAGQNFFSTTVQNLSAKSSLNSYDDSILGIYKVHDWPSSLPNTALAVTQIRGLQKSSHIQITHADILVNYDYFSFATDGTWGYDLQTVMVHELGHFLGLLHDDSSINSSVMYPSIGRFTINQTPYSSDIDTLTSKYGISRSGVTASSRNLVAESLGEDTGTPVVITFELHANNEEVVKINGVIQKDFDLGHSHK